MTRGRDTGGFTLMELLITIGVMAVALAIAIPSFVGWLPDFRLKAAARDLYSNFQKAKLSAVKRNLPCAVMFHEDGNGNTTGYTVFLDANSDFIKDAGEDVVATVNWADYTSVSGLPATFDNSSGAPVIAFRPTGLASDNNGGFANGMVTIKNTKNKTASLTVSQSGNIKLN